MSLKRLQSEDRVPNARRLEICTLAHHDLRFHKISKDGSSKCDAFFTGQDSDRIWGMLYEINELYLPALRNAEGLGYGYEEKSVIVFDQQNRQHTAMTYFASSAYIGHDLKPYEWYKNHVLTGAEEGFLPEDYIARIEVVACVQDPETSRAEKEFSIYL